MGKSFVLRTAHRLALVSGVASGGAALAVACANDIGRSSPLDSGLDSTQQEDASGLDATKLDTSVGDTSMAPDACDFADTGADPLNCGTCGRVCPVVKGATATCDNGACALSTDEQVNKLWLATAPTPFLTLWSDGTVLASSNNGTASLIDAKTGVATSYLNFAPGRPSIYIPAGAPLLADGGKRPEFSMFHWGSFDAYYQNKSLAWSNGVHGCCGSAPWGYAVEPKAAQMFAGHNLTIFALDNGGTHQFLLQYALPDGQLFVSPTWIYEAGASNEVYKVARSDDTIQWKIKTPSQDTALAAALTSTEGLVVVSSAHLARIEPNATVPWEVPVIGASAPIITSSGLVVLGEVVGEVPSLCAHDLGTGSSKWCTQLANTVTDLFAGDDGVIYVAINTATAIYGFDATSGKRVATYQNVSASEMLLRQGTVYASAGTGVTAFEVPAKGYDPSSWPVQHHDNQRTNGTVGDLKH